MEISQQELFYFLLNILAFFHIIQRVNKAFQTWKNNRKQKSRKSYNARLLPTTLLPKSKKGRKKAKN